jgi:hypothetical protein
LPIDPKLLEIIDRIEDHFGVRQVEVISGYRSTTFNKELKATGHAVANESFHTKGWRRTSIWTRSTRRRCAITRCRWDWGRGLLRAPGFRARGHGPVRTWGEEGGTRKAWIGEKNETCPVTLTIAPTRRIGAKGLDSLKVEGGEIEPLVDIEFFDRGKWTAVGKVDARVPLSKQEEPFVDQSFGKFRLKARVKGQADVFQYSNEFYFKRI